MEKTFTGTYTTNLITEFLEQINTGWNGEKNGSLVISKDHITVDIQGKAITLAKSEIRIHKKFYNRFRIEHKDTRVSKYLVFSAYGISQEIVSLFEVFGYNIALK